MRANSGGPAVGYALALRIADRSYAWQQGAAGTARAAHHLQAAPGAPQLEH